MKPIRNKKFFLVPLLATLFLGSFVSGIFALSSPVASAAILTPVSPIALNSAPISAPLVITAVNSFSVQLQLHNSVLENCIVGEDGDLNLNQPASCFNIEIAKPAAVATVVMASTAVATPLVRVHNDPQLNPYRIANSDSPVPQAIMVSNHDIIKSTPHSYLITRNDNPESDQFKTMPAGTFNYLQVLRC